MEIYSFTTNTDGYSSDRYYHSFTFNNHWTSFLLSTLCRVRIMMATIDGYSDYSFMIELIITDSTTPITLCVTIINLSIL